MALPKVPLPKVQAVRYKPCTSLAVECGGQWCHARPHGRMGGPARTVPVLLCCQWGWAKDPQPEPREGGSSELCVLI
jgi:hypothetical protein